MSKYLLLFSSLILVLASCKKETPYDHPEDSVVFAGDYSIAELSKIHHITGYDWSKSRIINTVADNGTDYRRHIQIPDSGGGAGFTDEITYDVQIMSSNFLFSNAYEWEMTLDLDLTRTEGAETETIHHELSQGGDFEILAPDIGTDYDFALKLNFLTIEYEMTNEVYNADDDVTITIDVLPEYEGALSVRSSVIFEATLTEGIVFLKGIVVEDFQQDYSNNTYIINEGLVDLTLQLK